MPYPYRSIERLLRMIEEPHRSLCVQLFSENQSVFERALGSSRNHQAWAGGYLDHIQECMNIGFALYNFFQDIRPLPFSRSDALLVLFLHDLEKPWRFVRGGNGMQKKNFMQTKAGRQTFRSQKIKAYGIKLTAAQNNAMRYVEGELDDYSPERRVMNPLAAFCHLADVTSARIWFGNPWRKNDPWKQSSRRRSASADRNAPGKPRGNPGA